METGINPDPVMAILQGALQQQPEEREAYLRSACDGDHGLYRELADALRWEERMGNFLMEPLVDFTSPVCPFEPGQTIGDGRFEILREIGEGGMGVVYEAFDRKLQQKIAIKAAKPGFQRLLSPELKAALKVRHQNICLVKEIHTAQTDYGEVDFLAMELLEGETLSAHLAKAGKLSHEEALDIACQVAAGLAEAHRSGIIHRDLKSGNVILCKNEDGTRRAVITDFGLAGGTAITSGEVAGTPAYMAPELWRGEQPSKASDVYALGVMLHEMVAGRRPYEDGGSSDEFGTTGPLLSSVTQEQWQHQAYSQPPASPSRFVKHLDPRWDRVIVWCLQPVPNQRPEASAVLTQLLRKPIRKAVYAVPALLILALAAAAAFVHFRLQQRRLTDKDTIVIADFDNKTGDTVFDDTLKTGLTVALNQSPFLNVVSENKVAATLKQMTRPVTTRLTQDVARELCLRTNSKAHIAGSIAILGTEYVIGLKAVIATTATCWRRNR